MLRDTVSLVALASTQTLNKTINYMTAILLYVGEM